MIITALSSNGGTGVLFSGNEAQEWGGAIYSYNSDFTISNAHFYGNIATSDGGAIWLSGGNSVINGGTFTNNVAVSGSGGAIYQSDATLTIDGNTQITGNKAGEYGGGIATYITVPYTGTGSFSLAFGANTLIYNNTATTAGDDLFALHGSLVDLSGANNSLTTGKWVWDPDATGTRMRNGGQEKAYDMSNPNDDPISLVWWPQVTPPQPPVPPVPPPGPVSPCVLGKKPTPALRRPGFRFICPETWDKLSCRLAAVAECLFTTGPLTKKAQKKGVYTPIQGFPSFASGDLDATAMFDLLKVSLEEDASRDPLLHWLETNGMLLDAWVMTLGGTDQQPGFRGVLTVRINVGKERAGDVLYILRYVEGAYELTECLVDEYGMITFTTDRLGFFLMLSDWDHLYKDLDEFIRENGLPNSDTDGALLEQFSMTSYDLQMLDALYNKLFPAT